MVKNKVLYILLVIFLAGAAALSGAAVGGLVVYQALGSSKLTGTVSSNPQVVLSSAPTQEQLLVNNTDIQTSITQAVEAVGPAVVTVVGTLPGQMTIFGPTGEQTVSGSGVFISDQGYILTNNHVVEGTQRVSIILSDGSQENASIIGTDKFSDVAVLKAEGTVPAAARLGNSDLLDPGETVIAIGSPLGNFKNSVTVGVVSATGRSIDTGQGYLVEGLIQTDAAINQGNSGGPLVDLAGEVIAINTLIVRSSGGGVVAEGLGFAIPINTADAVAEQIIQTGHFSRPYLGVAIQSINPEIASAYRLPVQYGAYVSQVQANSPASQAGLKVGDIITKLGDTAIDESHSYLNALFLYSPGDTISVDFTRDGNTQQVQVTLVEASAG